MKHITQNHDMIFPMPAPIDWFDNRGDRLPVLAGNERRRNRDSCTRTLLELILLLMFVHTYILTENTNTRVIDIQKHIRNTIYVWNNTTVVHATTVNSTHYV